MLSLYILFLSFAVYLSATVWASFPYFLSITLLLGLHGYICLFSTGVNILYLFRYFLVWLLIFGTALVWYLYPGEVFVAPFGLNFQNVENTRILVLAGMFSLCGSLIGWHTALLRFDSTKCSEFMLPSKYRLGMRRAGLIVAVLFSLLYVWKAGGIVGGGKTYADGQEGFSIEFGVFNLFHFTGISLLLLSSICKTNINFRYLVISILTLIPGMLAGSRADFLPQAFVVFLLVFNSKILELLVFKRYFAGVKYFLVLLAILSSAYLISTFIAIARTGVDPWLVVEIMLENETGRLISSVYGHKMLYFETGNMMLGGLYSAIVQVREGYTGLLFGESYFNYLLISPPAFLGFPRPLGLEWATEVNGTMMTQGGIFEVAEAYWNFGLIGCFIVSFVISYFFGWILRRGLEFNNYFYLTWYIVYGLHGFRSIWYQNFGYFRLMTVMLVIYMFCVFSFRWFIANRRILKSNLCGIGS
ncbi:MAG: hypothetical protein Q7V56_11845 [Gammaproteobacteria bacterium]|nr:hypothetical protein [Gammaproteobacteria bacterium]